jgi:hypothetical protein
MATRTIANGGGAWSSAGTWVEGFAPTAADDVVATGTSGALTVDAGAVCRSIDLTGYTSTVTHTAGVTLTIGTSTANGTLALLFPSTGWTYTLGNVNTSAITFASTAATQLTIDTGGHNLGTTKFNGAGGSWLLSSGITIALSGSFQVIRGALDTGSQPISVGTFQVDSGFTRSLTLGSSTITITNGGSVAWSAAATGLTFSAGTSTISFAAIAAPTTFAGGGLTYNAVTIAATNVTISGSNTFASLAFTGGTTTVTWTAGTTQTVTTFTEGSGSAHHYTFVSSSPGSQWTLSKASGTFTANYVSLTDSNATGGATWQASANATNGGNDTGWQWSYSRTFTDAEGITDSLANQTSRGIFFDVIGLADVRVGTNTADGTLGTAQSRLGFVSLGLPPGQSSALALGQALSAAQAPTDAEGLTDTALRTLTRTLVEALGLTDAEASVQTMIRAIADAEGISDPRVAAQAAARALTDPEGLPDPRVPAQAASRPATDPEGLTDAIAARAVTRTLTETVGLTDPRSQAVPYIRVVTESLGLLDLINRSGAGVDLFTDRESLADPLVQATASSRAIAEAEGLTDPKVAAQAAVRPLTEPEGLTDQANLAQHAIRATIEAEGLTDPAVAAQAAARPQTNPLGLSDPLTLTEIHAAADPLTLTDPIGRAITRALTDTIGLTDQHPITETHTITDDDQLADLADIAVQTATYRRTLTDALKLIDTMTRIEEVFPAPFPLPSQRGCTIIAPTTRACREGHALVCR